MACKRRVVVVVDAGWGAVRLEGFLHPAGCMGARYPHLDLECRGGLWLCDVVMVRGVGLGCRSVGGCVVVVEPGLGLSARLCVEGCRLRCGGVRVYVMRTRSGMLYIGPLEAVCGSRGGR